MASKKQMLKFSLFHFFLLMNSMFFKLISETTSVVLTKGNADADFAQFCQQTYKYDEKSL